MRGKHIDTNLKSEEHVVKVLPESSPKSRPHDAASCLRNQRGQIHHQRILHVHVCASRRPVEHAIHVEKQKPSAGFDV